MVFVMKGQEPGSVDGEINFLVRSCLSSERLQMTHGQHEEKCLVMKGMARGAQSHMAHLAMTEEHTRHAHALTFLSNSRATAKPDFKPSS